VKGGPSNCELVGYMKEINSQKLAPIQAIISFASQMEQDFIEIDEGVAIFFNLNLHLILIIYLIFR
jgi:hypothetical protein